VDARRAGRGHAGILLLATSILCIGALELSLRAILPAPPLEGDAAPARQRALRYAESAVSRHALAAAPLDVDAARGLHYRINGKGYRGEEFDWQKPPGVLRVLVYGGSSVFDIYQDEGQDWPARLERLLSEAGIAAEVINAGIPGHTCLDSVGLLLAEGHRLAPDYVLLSHGWNDMKYFRDPAPVLRQVRPLRLRESLLRPQGRLDAAFAAHSHLYRHLRMRFLRWDRDLGEEGRLPEGPLRDSFAPEQVAQFALALATFSDLARNAGAVPVLVTQPMLIAPDNAEADRARIHYEFVGLEHAALARARAAAEDAVRRVANAEQVALIDASARMSGRSRWFRDAVHLSDEGSAQLASLVARELAELVSAAGTAGPPRARLTSLPQ
jgi:lysophospholipase L1-like esterase